MMALIQNVSFEGVTGRVQFNDASSHPARRYNGDRTVGVRYEVRNHAGSAGLTTVGKWKPCDEQDSEQCDFSTRWEANSEQALTYSTADNSRPFDGAEIGLLLRLTDASVDLGTEPRVAACAALLAARHATEHNGAVVPELATLSHGFFMHMRLADMSTNAPTAIEAYRSVETADVDGIVDGASSAVNVHLAQLGALDALPQLSYYSSSPGLSSATYSHFGRTYISDHISAKVLTREISTFKWQYMGVLHLRDTWASTYADYLAASAASAAEHKMTIQVMASWSPGNATEMKTAAKMLRDSGVSVIVFLTFEADIKALMDAVEAEGLLASEYVWIAVEGSIFLSQSQGDKDLTRQLDRMLSMEANPTTSSGFARLSDTWASLSPADCVTDDGLDLNVPASRFTEPPNYYAAYAYDAVTSFALALDASSDPHDSAQLLEALRKVSCDGATGGLRFEGNGDRTEASATFSLSRFIKVDPQDAAAGLTQTIVRTMGSEGSNHGGDLVWRDGTQYPDVPTDLLRERYKRQADLLFTLMVTGAVLVPVFILIAVAAYYRGEKRKRKEYTQKKVREAIIALRSIDHPYTFIPANEFLKLGKLRPHEELRDERKLLYFDSVKGLDEQKKIVFFSHQWTAWAEPDPDVLQYPVMVAALRHVVRHSGWKLDDVVVWVDLFSIPQANRKLQILAINTIAMYCATAHAFIICAPRTVHKDTNQGCDTESYQRRMWCRCEQLCHALRNGTQRMWVATNTSECQPLGTLGLDWLKPLLRVFEGDVTVEEDKLSIVAPILGLYAELYQHLHSRPTSVLEQLAQPIVMPLVNAVSVSHRMISQRVSTRESRESKFRGSTRESNDKPRESNDKPRESRFTPTIMDSLPEQSSGYLGEDSVTVSTASLPEAPVAVNPVRWRQSTIRRSLRTPSGAETASARSSRKRSARPLPASPRLISP